MANNIAKDTEQSIKLSQAAQKKALKINQFHKLLTRLNKIKKNSLVKIIELTKGSTMFESLSGPNASRLNKHKLALIEALKREKRIYNFVIKESVDEKGIFNQAINASHYVNEEGPLTVKNIKGDKIQINKNQLFGFIRDVFSIFDSYRGIILQLTAYNQNSLNAIKNNDIKSLISYIREEDKLRLNLSKGILVTVKKYSSLLAYSGKGFFSSLFRGASRGSLKEWVMAVIGGAGVGGVLSIPVSNIIFDQSGVESAIILIGSSFLATIAFYSANPEEFNVN